MVDNKNCKFPKTKRRFWTIVAFLPLALITFPIGLGVWLGLLWWSFDDDCQAIKEKEEFIPPLKRPEFIELNKWENLSEDDKKTKVTNPFYIKYPAGWGGLKRETSGSLPYEKYKRYGGELSEDTPYGLTPQKYVEYYKQGKVTWVDTNDPVVVEYTKKWIEALG